MTRISVLLAEDDHTHAQLFRDRLVAAAPEMCVDVVDTATSFLSAVERRTYDCVILDYNLNGVTADAVLASAAHALKGCPVLVTSASEEQRVVIASMRSGVSDFLPKTDALTGDTLIRRVRSAVDQCCARKAERRKAERRERELVRLVETDHLTRLYNRRHFDRLLENGRRRRDRRQSTSCVMIDIDHFKKVNDTHGHACGDTVLRVIAGVIESMTSGTDRAFRWGGEEFMVLRRSCAPLGAWLWSERLRERVERVLIDAGHVQIGVTVSVGVASFPSSELSEDTVKLADHALYLAKERGRNRVCPWEMVQAERLAEETAQVSGLTAAARLKEFLRRAADRLGPVQNEHLHAHSRRVSRIASRIAELIGMERADAERLRLAGLFHDLGKCVVPEELLAKSSGLSGEERGLVARHSDEGAHLGRTLGLDEATAQMVQLHHQPYEARGARLARGAPDLPLGARVLAVADAFVTMLESRPYRAARSAEEAIEELQRHRGRQFDPLVVDAARLGVRTPVRLAA